MKLDELIAKCRQFVPKISSLKIERLMLCIPLNAIENESGEKF